MVQVWKNFMKQTLMNIFHTVYSVYPEKYDRCHWTSVIHEEKIVRDAVEHPYSWPTNPTKTPTPNLTYMYSSSATLSFNLWWNKLSSLQKMWSQPLLTRSMTIRGTLYTFQYICVTKKGLIDVIKMKEKKKKKTSQPVWPKSPQILSA